MLRAHQASQPSLYIEQCDSLFRDNIGITAFHAIALSSIEYSFERINKKNIQQEKTIHRLNEIKECVNAGADLIIWYSKV